MVLLAGALSSCGGLLGGGPAAPPPARDASWRGIRMCVDERVAIVAEGTIGAGFDRALRSAVLDELARAGLTVGDSNCDLVGRLEGRVEGAATFVRGRAALSVESGGATLDEVGTEQEVHAAREFPTAIARRLVGQLVASPRLMAFARERAPAAAPAAPASDAVASARQHTQQGTAFYNLDRFSEALAEYQAAYLAAPDPALLFNIAQCHRRMGNRAEASDYYRKYLRSAPQAPNRAEVERRLQELEGPRPRRRG
jgi:hypothetical protein